MADKVTELNELNLAFAERFNARDVDGLMALMAPGVVFVPAPGQALTGEAVWKLAAYVKSLGPGTGENQGGEGGGDQGVGSEGGGKQAGGVQSD